jgi:hypothetical protein
MSYEPNAFPVRATSSMFKPSKAESRAERDEKKQAVKDKEDRNKSGARKRDDWMCRFPRCSCHSKRLHPEVAHADGDKGSGGDHGTKSHRSQLVCLCPGRHRESRISLHRKTLRIEWLTEDKADGAIRWWVNVAVLDDPLATVPVWVVVASESRPRVLEPLSKEQGALLERIAEMAS